MLSEKRLPADYKKYSKSQISGNRTRNLVTFNPNSAQPRKQLDIKIPRLSRNDCLAPGSLNLVFGLKIGITKNYMKNNFSKLLQSRLEIRYGGEVIYDNTSESIFEVYRDKWLSKSHRDDMMEYGIGSENWRKLTSEDDSGATSGSTEKVQDRLMSDIFGTKLNVKLCNVLQNIGLFVPNTMMNNLEYIVTLPSSSDVLLT